ncbi:hypothetical protein AB0933_32800 [Streptomyces venezuelae]|uniref:hypothetical protein n=1 Tax=Streptomyces venezuelae TaxID=54571 RepID=UPI0034565317
MTKKTAAWDRLLDLIDTNKAADHGLSPSTAIAEAIRESVVNAPSLRHCLYPGCLREFDIASRLAGAPPPRPSWSGDGWAQLGGGTIFPAGGHICPDHKDLVTAHLPRRLQLPNGRWAVDCACGWTPAPQRWHGVLRALWEQHLLEENGVLPAAPPVTDPEHRIPLAGHTDATLAELYDRLWDAEADQSETRDTVRACMLGYTTAAPALLGAKTALENLRARITTDSRDWAADKLDAWLWAILVGWDCENTDTGHVHNDIDCAGDQGLWNIARELGIPADQTIQAHNHRWWIANAIKAATQIEEQTKGPTT